MEIKPTEIIDSGDGTGTVKNLVWTGWGSPVAHATGTQEVVSCNPSCATGKTQSYPATVTVEGLTSYGTGLEAYSTIVIQSAGGGPSSTYNAQTTIPS